MSAPRYRRAREIAGLSLKQAERLLGWQGTTTLSDIEDGSAEPGEGNVAALAATYMCSVPWLRGDDIEPPPDLVKALRDKGVSDHDSDIVLELAASIAGMPPMPSARERIAAVAKRKAPTAGPTRAAKVRYVKAQRQTRKHHCHWTGCTKQVPPAMWGCKAHWFRLPKNLRDRIWAAYSPGQEVDLTPSEAYLEVADEVQRWIAEHGGAP